MICDLHSTIKTKSFESVPKLFVAVNLYVPPSFMPGFVKMTLFLVGENVMLLGTGAVEPTLSNRYSGAGVASTVTLILEIVLNITLTRPVGTVRVGGPVITV